MPKCPKCGWVTKDNRFIEAKVEAQKAYKRAFERWTPEEDEKLARLTESGVLVLEISKALERQPSAIMRRIEMLGLQIGKKISTVENSKTLEEIWAEKEADEMRLFNNTRREDER